MTNANPRRVTTGKVRLSYCNLFTPYAREGQEPKYSTTILLSKTDFTTKAAIDAAVQAAKTEGISKCWNGVQPPIVAVPIHDGDGARPSDGMPFGDECKGHWVFTASTKNAPEVVDASVQPIIDQTEIYSGIYARVAVEFFPYNSNGKKGIGCALGNVQKLADGESLGYKRSAAEDFGAAPPAPNTYTAYDPITGMPL